MVPKDQLFVIASGTNASTTAFLQSLHANKQETPNGILLCGDSRYAWRFGMGLRRWNDQELRRLRLSISDPHEQVGLVSVIPDGAELVGVQNTYQLSRTQPKARCAVCRRAVHWAGWTGVLCTGELVLLGKKCGGDTFGSWEDATAELEAEKTRQYSLRRLDHLREVAGAVRAGLGEWRVAAKYCTDLLGQIDQAVPDLYAQLLAASRIGSLRSHQRIQTRTITKGKVKLGVRYEDVSHGPLVGANWFLGRGAVHNVDELADALSEVTSTMSQDTNALSSRRLRSIRDRIDAAIQGLERIEATVIGMEACFSPKGVAQLAQWSQKHYAGQAGIVDSMPGHFSVGGQVLATLPANHPHPSGNVLHLLAMGPAESVAA